MWSLLFNFLGSGACVRTAVLVLCLGVTGCQLSQWRVFQSKVPEPLQKPAVQVEAERQSADWLAKTVSAPPEAVPVAQKLAASLGEPEHPIAAKTPQIGSNEALTQLTIGIVEAQRLRDDLNEKLAKYEGKKIEGTGFNVFGLSMSLPVLGVIAALIFFPGVAIPLLASTLKRVRGTLAAVVQGVQDYKDGKETDLDTALSKRMDAAHKMQIKKVNAKL